MGSLQFFATVAQGGAPFLARELTDLGVVESDLQGGGVAFAGTLEDGYRVALWSRLSSRVLLALCRVDPCDDADALFAALLRFDWLAHMSQDVRFAVQVSAQRAPIKSLAFAVHRTKDAIVDHIRDRTGVRPSVDKHNPDLTFYLHWHGRQATLYLDLGGEGLHRRGYRGVGGRAPLRETLAALLLHAAGWPERWRLGETLVDPFCGAGTIAIEAALIAADVAPGLQRRRWGFDRWRQHDASVWQGLAAAAEARSRAARPPAVPARIIARDKDARVLGLARDNAQRAGVAGWIAFVQRDITEAKDTSGGGSGVVVTNPPYGRRLQPSAGLRHLYDALGGMLKREHAGWDAYVLTDDVALGRSTGLRATHRRVLFNGDIKCTLLTLPIAKQARETAQSDAARSEAFENRLRKNLRRLASWRKREKVSCFRVYDSDLPEYAAAIDVYGDRVHIQEYAPPAHIDPGKARMRLRHMIRGVAQVFQVTPEAISLKERRRQRATEQYQRHGSSGAFFCVDEGPHRFWVNLDDYLDTGLFLDQRLTRSLLGGWAAGRDFLNLFGYTATASVYAAAGGARSTTTVDMSRAYLEWAERNFALNRVRGPRHRLLRADCLTWLASAARQPQRYGLIFVDPPTFSNSKRMRDHLVIQRDHVRLLRLAATLLHRDGSIVFANNFKRFKLDAEALRDFHIEDLATRTLSPDFARAGTVHRVWRLSRAPQDSA